MLLLILVFQFGLLKAQPQAQQQASNSAEIRTTTEKIAENYIVNPHDFNYLHNPGESVCGRNKGSDIFLLIYVHSSPGNYKNRLAIRETWSQRFLFNSTSKHDAVKIVFMMGKSENKKLNSMLDWEYNSYNDIVQEDFIDSYRNLTYKGIMAVRWVSEYCSNIKFVLKIDDDIIVNTYVLLRHLKSLSKHQGIKPKTVMCNVWTSMKVMRDKKSKWYISESDFKQPYFGRYCSGSAFLYTGDLAAAMYNASLYVKFFWVDDYYVSGLLTRASNATFQFFNSLYIINSAIVEQRFKGPQADYTVFGHLPGKLNKIYELWSHIHSTQIFHMKNLPADVNKYFNMHPVEYRWSGNDMWKPFLGTDM